MDRKRQYGLIAAKEVNQPDFIQKICVCSHEELEGILKSLRQIHPHILVPFRLAALMQNESVRDFEELFLLQQGQFSPCAERWLHRFLPPKQICALLQDRKEVTMEWENNPIFDQLVEWWKRGYHVFTLFVSTQQEEYHAIERCPL